MDRRNLAGLARGQRTALTANPNAKVVDLVTTQAGKVVARMQLKDTLSSPAVGKTVQSIAGGKYHSARLLATPESAAKLNKGLEAVGSTRRVASSGVSSKTTTALAQRAGAAGSGGLGSAVRDAAHAGGVAAAVIGAGVEAFQAVSEMREGRIDPADAAVRVGKAGA